MTGYGQRLIWKLQTLRDQLLSGRPEDRDETVEDLLVNARLWVEMVERKLVEVEAAANRRRF